MILLFTAFSVSIDAYVTGLALAMGCKTDNKQVFCVILFTFLMSLTALFLGSVLRKYTNIFAISSGILLILLGIKNIISSAKSAKVTSLSAPLVGISVGADAMIASFTFAVPVLFAFAVALVMSVFHGAFFILGSKTAGLLKGAKKATFASGVFLILLGVFRLL